MHLFYSCLFLDCSWQGVLDTTLCDKVCQWLATGRWFSLGTLVSFTNKTDCLDIVEILLKVALNTINLNLTLFMFFILSHFQDKTIQNWFNFTYSSYFYVILCVLYRWREVSKDLPVSIVTDTMVEN